MPNSRGCCAKRSRPSSRRDLVERSIDAHAITELAADELEAWELSAMRDRELGAPGRRDRRRQCRRRRRSSCCAHGAERAARQAARRPLADARPRRPSIDQGPAPADAPAARRPLNRERRAGAPTCRLAPVASYALNRGHGHLLSPPSRETGVLVLELRPPRFVPTAMTTTPGGHALPRCAGQRTVVKTLRSTARRPELTIALIVVNVLVFLAEGHITLTGGEGGKIYEKARCSESIEGFPRSASLTGNGGAWSRAASCTERVAHRLHMYVLYVARLAAEPALGRLRFGLIYAVSLLAGSLGALLVSPHSPTVGASGAVFRIMGAAAVEVRARRLAERRWQLDPDQPVISFTLPGSVGRAHRGNRGAWAIAFQAGARRRAQSLAVAASSARRRRVAGSIAVAKSSEVAERSDGLIEPR